MRLLQHLRGLANHGAIRLEPYVIGLILCLTVTLVTVWLGMHAMDSGEPCEFDQSIALTMKDLGNSPTKGKWMMGVTFLGDRLFLAGAAVLGAIWLLVRGERRLALAWCLIALGGFGLNEGLKRAIVRERPPSALRNPIVTAPPTSYSFPSGHALGSTVVFGLFGYVMFRDTRRRLVKVLVAVEVLLIIGAVCFSRVYLGVHWASDVIAGVLIGAAWLALTLGFLESWLHRKSR